MLLDGVEGGFTRNFLSGGDQATIYDASVAYQAAGVPLVILAGKEYGSGSSRDWAAKGTQLLGVKAVITRSFERCGLLTARISLCLLLMRLKG
jgi:aconitate hydratase